MIVFVQESTFIRVMGLDKNERMTENLGKIFRTTKNTGPGSIIRPEWIWDGYYRAMDNESIDDSEKRQIIRLLDNLNGLYSRPQEGMRTQWEKLIGLNR